MNYKKNSLKTIIYTSLALIAFAANSVLCRKALGEGKIDAAGFTIIRLLSGSLILFIILNLPKRKKTVKSNGNWFSSMMLFLYAVCFSFAYITLDTGTGALIAFAVVQITIISQALFSGHRLSALEIFGTIMAFAGFVYLVFPELNTPTIKGFILMTISGVGWGMYTIRGQGSINPLNDTAFNFIRTIPFVLVLFVLSIKYINLSFEGVLLALISGAITSGIGYTIWYLALMGLSKIQSAVVQLLVPIIAAFGGVIFMNEVIGSRLSISSMLILGGILVVLIGKNRLKNRY